jgi:hypothetical protein
MTTRAAIRMADLRRLARLAGETGQAVVVETPDGSLVRIAPPGANLPLGSSERESAECDRAFGMGGETA